MAPSGAGGATSSVWVSPVPSVARTMTEWIPSDASHGSDHCRQVVSASCSASCASCHSAPSMRTSTRFDAPGGRPCHPGEGCGPGRDARPVAGYVDARLGLDRRLLGPAPRDPVGVETLPRGQLDLAQPLRRRDVAVQPGNHQPRREAVLDRQRLAVHTHRNQRVPSVQRHRRREADGESVDRPADHLGGARLDPGPLQQVGRGTPSQRALPTRSPPTSLRHQARVM